MAHRPLRYLQALLLAAVLVACGGVEKPRVASGELLAGIPVMPRSVPVSSAAGSDAVEAGYTTADVPDSVAAWYRRWFLRQGWRITGDLPAAGGVTVAAEKERRPVWLIIRPLANHQGSVFSVVAAGSDTAAAHGTRP